MAVTDIRLSMIKPELDPATLLGLGAGFGVLFIAMALGGSLSAFFDLPAFLIVFGGTFSVTTMCFSLPEMGRTWQASLNTLFHASRDPAEAALKVLQIANTARRNNTLYLQNILGELEQEPVLHKGVQMAVDNIPAEEIDQILRRDLQTASASQLRSAAVLRKASEVSPAMGLIGTLIGLVQMLGNLDDPSRIGPGMAVALITTFYGAVLANMVFAPLAAKLERNNVEENLVSMMFSTGAVSIARQENPRRLEMLLNSALPPGKRVAFFD